MGAAGPGGLGAWEIMGATGGGAICCSTLGFSVPSSSLKGVSQQGNLSRFKKQIMCLCSIANIKGKVLFLLNQLLQIF